MKHIRGHFHCAQLKSIVAGLSVAVLSSSLALSQSTFGSVRGTVQDSTGAAIPGAQITLHNADDNGDKTATADAGGGFVFENVKAGQYSLRRIAMGFQTLSFRALRWLRGRMCGWRKR